jgi:hypothetical protein
MMALILAASLINVVCTLATAYWNTAILRIVQEHVEDLKR